VRIFPWTARDLADPRCQLHGAAGLSWGERFAREPAGRLALWLFRSHYLYRRTRSANGSLSDHWRFTGWTLQVEIGRRSFSLKLV